MDKDDLNGFDLTEKTPFIHSVHGSCGNKELTSKYKQMIFPELSVSDQDLTKSVASIKRKLIESNDLNEFQLSKRRCDLAIRYWLSIMKVGDLVFVRNKINEVYLCKVSDYVSEKFFDSYGCFQRPVEILQKLSESMVHKELWHRTHSRKTIERNAKTAIVSLVKMHLKEHDLALYL